MRGVLLPLLLALPVAVRAERLPFEAFTTVDGLARDGLCRIVSDPDGFPRVATSGGLSQFDGNRFTNFGPRDGLRGLMVHDVAIGRSGKGWVATEAGLFLFRPGEPPRPGGLFHEVPLQDVPQHDQPHRLLRCRRSPRAASGSNDRAGRGCQTPWHTEPGGSQAARMRPEPGPSC